MACRCFAARRHNETGTTQPDVHRIVRESRRAAFQPILDAVTAANQATPPVPKTSDTVAKAVAERREHAAVALKPSTRRSAESHLRGHILPLLGECPLTDLTVKRMQTFANSHVGKAYGKDDRKRLADALLDSEFGPQVGLQRRGGRIF